MLIQMPRILCLRPVSGAAATAALLKASHSMSSILPVLVLGYDSRAAAPNALPCICLIHSQPANQQRCHLHHRPPVCASLASTSSPASANPRPRTRHPQLRPAPSAVLPTSTPALETPGVPFRCFTSASYGGKCIRRTTATFAGKSNASTEDVDHALSSPSAVDAATCTAVAQRRQTQPEPPSAGSSPSATMVTVAAVHMNTAGATAITASSSSSSSSASSQPGLTSGLGQVIASASNYVRVELYQLLPDQEHTPPDWRPPHLRPWPAVAAAEEEPPLPQPRLLLCSIRSLLRKLGQDVVVGDVVRVSSIDWREGRGVVSEVLPRSSRLLDPGVTNVDHVLLVFALDQPPFEELQVSRFLVAAEAAGLPFSLVLNKADLVGVEVVERRVAQCRSWGYEPLVLSCERGQGVEAVAEVLQGRISVVAGPSGAGKSSLINFLRRGKHRPGQRMDTATATPAAAAPAAVEFNLVKLPAAVVHAYGRDHSNVNADTDSEYGIEDEATGDGARADEAGGERGQQQQQEGEGELEFLAVGSVSRIGRGMHTTTAVTLLRLAGGGWLADTPGFGQPTLDELSSPDLFRCFPELLSLISTSCRFSDCLHLAEPGCSVSGTRLERYQHYLRFLQEIKMRESGDVRQLQRGKMEREGVTKTKSVRGGGERQEARLDPRRHRRRSRQSTRRAGQLAEEELLG